MAVPNVRLLTVPLPIVVIGAIFMFVLGCILARKVELGEIGGPLPTITVIPVQAAEPSEYPSWWGGPSETSAIGPNVSAVDLPSTSAPQTEAEIFARVSQSPQYRPVVRGSSLCHLRANLAAQFLRESLVMSEIPQNVDRGDVILTPLPHGILGVNTGIGKLLVGSNTSCQGIGHVAATLEHEACHDIRRRKGIMGWGDEEHQQVIPTCSLPALVRIEVPPVNRRD